MASFAKAPSSRDLEGPPFWWRHASCSQVITVADSKNLRGRLDDSIEEGKANLQPWALCCFLKNIPDVLRGSVLFLALHVSRQCPKEESAKGMCLS